MASLSVATQKEREEPPPPMPTSPRCGSLPLPLPVFSSPPIELSQGICQSVRLYGPPLLEYTRPILSLLMRSWTYLNVRTRVFCQHLPKPAEHAAQNVGGAPAAREHEIRGPGLRADPFGGNSRTAAQEPQSPHGFRRIETSKPRTVPGARHAVPPQAWQRGLGGGR